MPTTRKKVIKTVYKDENDSEADAGDFSDSGSEAVISQPSSSEDEEPDIHSTSEDEKKKGKKRIRSVKCRKITKRNTLKHTLQTVSGLKRDEFNLDPEPEPTFSVKDLTEADKQLPSILNLSESDSSDDETPKVAPKAVIHNVSKPENEDSETETYTEYKDVWSSNLKESEEIAKQTFLDLEKHKTLLEEAKESIQKYNIKRENNKESDVNDLLALGEEAVPSVSPPKIKKRKEHKAKCDSDSEMEDWEEVAEGKVPQQGLQLVVDFPDAVCRKSKKVDVEMMMKRKINRVKKEYQVYMHKVHVLCWLGHGNYVSQVLNDQDIMSAALTLIPSKECYPGERVDMKYIEQITTWFKDKLKVKFDKNEGKFRPKAPPLKNILLQQIQTGVVTSKKYIVFIFVSMLRAVGLQCRIMLNFTTLPIKPPITELCSLSTKPKSNEKDKVKEDLKIKGPQNEKKKNTKKASSDKIPQLDGNNDSLSENDFDNIMQVDGNDDGSLVNEITNAKSKIENTNVEDVSPPKRRRINLSLNRITSDESKTNKKETKATQSNGSKNNESQSVDKKISRKSPSVKRNQSVVKNETNANDIKSDEGKLMKTVKNLSLRRQRNTKTEEKPILECKNFNSKAKKSDPPKIIVTADESGANISSEYFNNVEQSESKRSVRARKRAYTCNPSEKQDNKTADKTVKKPRGKSAPGNSTNKSKYFDEVEKEKNLNAKMKVMSPSKKPSKENDFDNDETKRVSHRDLVKAKAKPKNDVTNDLVDIIKKRVKEAKGDVKKGKTSKSSDDDSDFLPEITECQKASTSKKSNVKAGTSRKIDRRILSTDDEAPSVKIDTWCEIFVEELEQWVAVDIIKGRVHCVNEIYRCATHPVTYVVGWDNNNYLKDLTRRYVPQWNTVTRKQRVDHSWWTTAIKPWLGPRTPRDREEDETLDRMQLDAPLPKSIAEYKNHPLYALKRHLLKFEAIYPPDAATLGFVRGEAVYARECVYVCRSRDTWLKEAKVVRLGQHPYKVVKARPKWDKLSNKLITDKPLEVFGPWQVQDYEPPVAENGIVPRNAYGNVELFKQCMLPKGTVHIKLPGLNRVAKKLNIDCAPAMTGFDFNGGWSHPVFDGFVVCEEFEDIIVNAWHEDQEEQERKEIEKTEARVYGHWRRLIKGLLIRERLKLKYGFAEPSTSQDKKKSAGPRLTVKKKFLEK